jgi:3-hydroxybutyryl-CoA dehydrogenase
MKVEEIRKIGVVGAGLMGHGIAMELAAAGYQVSLHDLSPEILQRAMATVQVDLRTLVEAGMLTAAQAEAAPGRLRPTTDLAELARDADLVIEAVAERLEVKHAVFGQLDTLCPERTILATNSSTLTASQIAPATCRPDRVLVAHYWNPPYLLPLVEIVGGPDTSPETVQTVYAFMRHIGKNPVVLQKEAPGFIGNRLQFALFREALSLVERGVARPEDVDLVVRSSFGRRLAVAGPFEVFDLAGYDVIHNACAYVFPDLDCSKEPPALLRQRVERGELGVKTGQGFYSWTREAADGLRRRIATALAWLNRAG